MYKLIHFLLNRMPERGLLLSWLPSNSLFLKDTVSSFTCFTFLDTANFTVTLRRTLFTTSFSVDSNFMIWFFCALDFLGTNSYETPFKAFWSISSWIRAYRVSSTLALAGCFFCFFFLSCFLISSGRLIWLRVTLVLAYWKERTWGASSSELLME